MTPRVVFDGVSKKFRRGERHDSLRDLVPSMARRLMGRQPALDLDGQEFWALRDVSFEVHPGEALGIIGPNGAGKSTALKVLTRILKPTRGRSEVKGRVGALIEVAAGFHPDLTGRENIFLQGAIMGMKRAEIAGKLDQIIDFAGVADFIDTPVKRYSSGMNARLGFSIAAHLDPEVLLIDEVLSVGDRAFQERCIDRMQAFKRNGVTIVFVSHNLAAVAGLCDRAVFLKQECRAAGPVADVVTAYLQEVHGDRVESAGALDVVGATLTGNDHRPAQAVAAGAALTLRVAYVASQTVDDVTFGFMLYRSIDRLVVYEATFAGEELGIVGTDAGDRFEIDFRFRAHLSSGQYHVECYTLHTPTHHFMSRLSPAALITVHESRTCRGVADLQLNVSPVEEVLGCAAGRKLA